MELSRDFLCRDVLAERVKRAMQGYSYPTKAGIKEVAGLGGSFTYLRSRRIPEEEMWLALQHEQTWTGLLMLHDLPIPAEISPLEKKVYWHSGEEGQPNIAYIAEDADQGSSKTHSEAYLTQLMKGDKPVIIYSARPRLTEDALMIFGDRVKALPIPDTLIKAFWKRGKDAEDARPA